MSPSKRRKRRSRQLPSNPKPEVEVSPMETKGDDMVAEKWSQIVKAVTTIGVPSVVALYLIYYLTQSLTADLQLIKVTQAASVAQMTTLVSSNNNVQVELSQIKKVLLASCVNAAKTQQERNNCFQ